MIEKKYPLRYFAVGGISFLLMLSDAWMHHSASLLTSLTSRGQHQP